MQVLIVEDSEDLAWALKALLCKLGHEVVSCATPAAALEAVKSSSPDLVLLDIDLPQMDGYALATLLRQRGFERTPMVTISSQHDNIARRRAAGIEAHYLKPIEFHQLHEILESAFER